MTSKQILIKIAEMLDTIKKTEYESINKYMIEIKNIVDNYTNEEILEQLLKSISLISKYKIEKFKDIKESTISISVLKDINELVNTVFINDSIGDNYRIYSRELTMGEQLANTVVIMNDLNNLISKTMKVSNSNNIEFELPEGLNIFIFLNRHSKDNVNTHALEVRLYDNRKE